MGSLQTCRDMGREIIRVYTKRFFNDFIMKSDVKVGFMLWSKTSGVFGSPRFQQDYNIMSLVTICLGRGHSSLHKQTRLDAENSRSLHFCSPLSSHSTCSTALASPVTLRPQNARSEGSLLRHEAPSCRNSILSL